MVILADHSPDAAWLDPARLGADAPEVDDVPPDVEDVGLGDGQTGAPVVPPGT